MKTSLKRSLHLLQLPVTILLFSFFSISSVFFANDSYFALSSANSVKYFSSLSLNSYFSSSDLFS